jgi:multicomponent Na+:H+ antiporter subunit F
VSGAPWYASVSALLLVGAIAIALVRVVRGPSTPDRVVALDLIATLVVGLVCVYALVTREPELLGAATVLALLGFLGTVAVARFLERRARA